MGRAGIERSCSALVAAFPHHLDRRRYDDVLSLFTQDGRFRRPGVDVVGQQELAAMLDGRPPEVATRHVCSAPLFTEVGETEARSITCFTLYQTADVADGYPAFDGPAAIAEYHDLFRLTDAGWRIAFRDVKVAMLARKA